MVRILALVAAAGALAVGGCNVKAPDIYPFNASGDDYNGPKLPVYVLQEIDDQYDYLKPELGERSGGILLEGYDARRAREQAVLEGYCADLGFTANDDAFPLCMRAMAGTPSTSIDDYLVADDGRFPPILWLDKEYHEFLAYRAEFVKRTDDAVEYRDRMANFIRRQQQLLNERKAMGALYDGG